tara:strand:- start:67 stop:600 length:534 start_codon:yes stop_codon:yes gene_type:complete
MSFRTIIASFSIAIGLIIAPCTVLANDDPSSKFKVLSTENSGLNINAIETLLDQAEVSIKSMNLDQAIDKLKKARTLSRLLVNYYRDLNGSFRGIDALIPREMSKKNRDVIELLAKANIQLATIHRTKGEPELAVPLLVDVVKILTPVNPLGSKAYQQLVELGFVDTPYRGAAKQSI